MARCGQQANPKQASDLVPFLLGQGQGVGGEEEEEEQVSWVASGDLCAIAPGS